MFIGHYAVGLAAKKAAPSISLGTLFLASQFVDLLWPILLLLGIEHVRILPGVTVVTPFDFYDYPYSHSLAAVIVWAVLFGGVYFVIKRRWGEALVLAACVVSHWILDALTHRPDLLLLPGGSTLVGLGLWNSLVGTLVVEGGLFLAGIVLYVRTTTPKDRVGLYGFWSLVVFVTLLYIANVFGPAPAEVQPVAIAGNAAWIMVVWAYWVDRHRMVRQHSRQMEAA